MTYASYLELLLLACSTYDKKIGTPGKQKRAVYATLLDDAGVDPLPEDIHHGEYEVFKVDTDISDIMAYNANTNRFGMSNTDSNTKTKYLPREEWNKLSQAQKDALIEKRRKERFVNTNQSMPSANRQANAHLVEDHINLDDLIDYTVMNHTTGLVNAVDDKDGDRNDDLLAFMSGHTNAEAGVKF